MQYKLHLNLRRRAALRTAISFWERIEVKDKAAEFFGSCEKFSTYEIRRKWREYTKTIVEEWNKEVLPKHLEDELIHIIKMTGERILSWYQYIKYAYKVEEEAINCIDKIHWTPYGTVDEVKIFKSSWLDNSNVDIIKVYNRVDGVDTQMFNLIYNIRLSTEDNMLRLSVYQGYFIATKYFWEKLTEEERDESVLICSRVAVMRYNHYAKNNESIRDFKRSQYVEICIFLMNQMSESRKKVFFNEKIGLDNSYHFNKADVKDEILEMLLTTWPWQELFMPVLKDMIQYQDYDSKMACKFLDAITDKMVKDHKLGYSLDTNKYRCFLREAWLIIPASIKLKIVQDYVKWDFMNDLIEVWDLGSLKLILNDPEIAAVRDKVIDLGSFSYKQLVVDDQFEKLDVLIEELFKFKEEKIQTLDQTIDKILRTGEERKSFKRKINPWSDIFKHYSFNLVDKLLNWQNRTPDEQQAFKNSINHTELCENFIKNDDYNRLEEFLKWKFETIEERITCKDHFKTDEFVIRHVYDIWKRSRRNINNAMEKSSRFLDWICESDEEIRCLKEEKLFNIEIYQSIIDLLISLHDYGTIDEFLSWCLLDDKRIQEIKRDVLLFIR